MNNRPNKQILVNACRLVVSETATMRQDVKIRGPDDGWQRTGRTTNDGMMMGAGRHNLTLHGMATSTLHGHACGQA